ncbi:MAG: hypothetical protein QW818_01795 [Candidatus Aenigmatarchaeota archaeon]|nr:hypothetical protein [Candidatus Aenigmarchaeota archaeon]
MKKTFLLTITMILLIIQLVYAADIPTSNQQQYGECNYNEYEIKISKLEQNITKLTNQLEYYKNLSEYYRELYESKNTGLTNKEVIEINKNLTIIYQNISNLFKKIENIENRFKIFSLEFGISIIGLTTMGVTIVEVILNILIRKKNHES